MRCLIQYLFEKGEMEQLCCIGQDSISDSFVTDNPNISWTLWQMNNREQSNWTFKFCTSRWWCYPHCTHLWGLCSPTRHWPSWPRRPRSHRLPDQDPHRERLQLRHHSWEGDCPWHQGEALLHCPGLRPGDADRRCLFFPGEELRASWWAGHHYWQWEIPCSRIHVPAKLHWYGNNRYPRAQLQQHHEVWHWYP